MQKENQSLLPKKMRGYINLLRPFTLLAPAIGGISGALMSASYYDFKNFDLLKLIYGIGALIALNAASNSLNQVYDLEIDKINKPYRPIPSGIVSIDEALIIAVFLYMASIFRSSLINMNFAIFVFAIALISIGYSMPPLRFKQYTWLSNISIAIARGLLLIVAGWSIFGNPFEPTEWVRIFNKAQIIIPLVPAPWLVGSIMCIYLIGAMTTKDFTDVEGDRKYGIKTLPVLYGNRKATLIIAPFFVLPFILIPLGVMFGKLIHSSIYLSVLAVWGAYIVYLLLNQADKRDAKFENSPAWKHMYLMLMAMQIGFMFVYVFYFHYGE